MNNVNKDCILHTCMTTQHAVSTMGFLSLPPLDFCWCLIKFLFTILSCFIWQRADPVALNNVSGTFPIKHNHEVLSIFDQSLRSSGSLKKWESSQDIIMWIIDWFELHKEITVHTDNTHGKTLWDTHTFTHTNMQTC